MTTIKDILNSMEKICKVIDKELNEMNKDYSKYTVEELRKEWNKLIEIYKKYAKVLVSFLPLDKALTETAMKEFGDKINIVGIPEKLLRIEKFIEDSKKLSLDELFKKYGYLFAYDFLEVPQAFENMKKSLKDLKDEKVDYERYKKFESFLGNLDEKRKELAKLVSKAVWLRTERTDILRLFFFVGYKILKRVSELFSIPYEDLCYYSIDEIKDLLEKNKRIDKSIIKKRKEEGYYLFSKENERILGELTEIEDIIKSKREIKSLKGMVASKGGKEFVEGEVKIVKDFEDLKDIDGKILVTSMTTPDMVPFMKKVIGIVTDEGGITCHAAIVSRELGIPCIVGTKEATKILRDGTKIKMDLKEGKVEILS